MNREMIGKSDPLVWTVFENLSNTQVGIVGLLAIVPDHGRAEIGHVYWYLISKSSNECCLFQYVELLQKTSHRFQKF